MKTRYVIAVLALPFVVSAGYGLLKLSGALGYHHIADFEEPASVTRLELHDGEHRTLWRIDSPSPRRLGSVDYGIVPTGFRQVLPVAGNPRPLIPDEPLLLIYTTDTGWCRHGGVAVGHSAFMGGGYFTGQLFNTPVDQVFSSEGPAHLVRQVP